MTYATIETLRSLLAIKLSAAIGVHTVTGRSATTGFKKGDIKVD